MEANNYSFEYIEKGHGDTVVLVHGSVSDYRTWNQQLEYFSKHYHTITYSRRFHWPNENISDNEDYSMHQHADDLEAILKKIGKPVHLIGHSYGAFICLLLAIKLPSLINSLVLAEPPIITLYVSNKPKPLEIVKLLFTRPKLAFALIKFGATGIEPATKMVRQNKMAEGLEIFGKATLGHDAYKNLTKERMEQINLNLIKAEFLGSGFPKLEKKQIQKIAIPTLLVTGQKSPKLFHFLVDRLEQLMPKTERVTISDASHIMHEDNPLEYNKCILSFLRKQNV